MESSYISLIKINGTPIIAPLMTDTRKEEMCYYRQLAVALEEKKKLRRQSIDSGVMIISVEKEDDVKTSVNENFNLLSHDIDTQIRQRRNSYTLDTPSPLLLALMESQSLKNSPIENNPIFPALPSKQNMSEQLTIADLETDVENVEKKSSKRKLYDNHDTSEEYTTAETDSSSNDDHVSKYIKSMEVQNTNINLDKNCANDSFSNDFLLLESDFQNNLHLDSNQENSFSDCSSVSLNIPSLEGDASPSELETYQQLKEKLTQKYRKQILSLVNEYEKENRSLEEKFQRVISRSSSLTAANSNTVKITEIKSPILSQIISKVPVLKRPSSAISVDDERKEKAATVINAVVRGYLIRRLFKTNRVMNLVQTIKDCLVTAVSLQNESNLELSELELQTRLLQQLTVAWNDLHDIFSMSVKDRMSVISEDREKKNRSFYRSTTPLPLSEATKRSLQRKLSNSAPPPERKPLIKRCGCVYTAKSGRKMNSTEKSHTYSPHDNRKPWR